MSDQVLGYLISLLSGLALPAFVLIISSWRVARLRNLTVDNFKDRVNESVAETIKEQLGEAVVIPLFTQQNVVLPRGQNAYSVISTLVPGDDVELLTSLYNDLAHLGIESESYTQLLQIVNSWYGGG